MEIVLSNLLPAHRRFLNTVGFTDLRDVDNSRVKATLPPSWDKIATTITQALLCEGLHVRAQLISAGRDEGYILIPLTAYTVTGGEDAYHIICRPKTNGSLIIQTWPSRLAAEEWLNQAYPGWRDPAKYWK